MADTYSTDLRIRLQEDGANSSTWGQITNTNLQLIEDAIAGKVDIATTGGTTVLTAVNGATDQSRYAILKVTGVLVSNATLQVPDVSKEYLIWNATSGAYTVTVKATAGTGVAVLQGSVVQVFCDGAEVYQVETPLSDLTGLGAGVATFLTTPSSANLRSAVTDETGTGSLVFANTPSLATPVLTNPSYSGATANAGTVTTIDINGGTIDGTTQASGTINGPIAAGGTWTAAAAWTLPAITLGGTVTSNGQSFSGTIANLGTVTTVDINGGTVDGAVIGGASAAAITGTTITATTSFAGALNGTVGATTPAAGTFTTLTSTGNATLGDAAATDVHAINGATTVSVNSASAALTINQTGSGNALVVEDATSPDSTPFVIDSGGSPIVGHTAKILSTSQCESHSLGAASNLTQAFYNWSSSTGSPQIRLYRSKSGVIGTQGAVASGDTLAFISAYGDDGTAFIPAASIVAVVDGTPGTNDMPGRLVFSTTADGASSATEALRINSAQSVIPAKLLDLSTSTAGQIKFPATQNASADANTLDDYEEGTFTPVLSDGTNNATATTALGRYTKIGRLVQYEISLTTSALGSVTGDLRITGLPFACNANISCAAAIGLATGLNITSGQNIAAQANAANSYLTLWLTDSAAGVTALQATEWSDDGSARICGTYTI
jgi:hypothetical protein